MESAAVGKAGDVLSGHLGDTFIDWHLDSPLLQWVRIVGRLESGPPEARAVLLDALDAVPREEYDSLANLSGIRAEQAEAERDRYREALKDIATDELGSYEMVGIAREALEAADG